MGAMYRKSVSEVLWLFAIWLLFSAGLFLLEFSDHGLHPQALSRAIAISGESKS